jgi:DNA polymerase III delta prime subunit
MELAFPPPHYLFFEPLNDKETLKLWDAYVDKYASQCEFSQIDAAEINSAETFSPWFDNWITQVPARQSTRVRVLIIWHSEFLTYSCQQMLRRSLENRSFRCRVWFHVEDPTLIQPAIQSRCIAKRIETFIHSPVIIDK